MAEARRTWGSAEYLALIGLPLLALELWTLVAWLADGPSQVTQYRDHGDPSWFAAHTFEVLALCGSVAMLVFIVRGCLRERRILTFDAMYCLAAATIFYLGVANDFHPVFLESSNFINLNNPCGHMPFVVNPDCGRVPDAIVFWWLTQTFCFLWLAVGATRIVPRIRSRWPRLSTAQLVLLLGLVGAVFDLFLEAGIAIPLHLWSYAPLPGLKLLGSHGFRYPVIVMIPNGIWIGGMMAVRCLRNDRGERFVERGLEHHSRARRRIITLMALYGFFQMLTWGINGILMAAGFYQSQWTPTTAHVLNGVCDAPGVEGTRYGPCPGSPGFRAPGRNSLPGRSP